MRIFTQINLVLESEVDEGGIIEVKCNQEWEPRGGKKRFNSKRENVKNQMR